jgi:hypothetical protein
MKITGGVRAFPPTRRPWPGLRLDRGVERLYRPSRFATIGSRQIKRGLANPVHTLDLAGERCARNRRPANGPSLARASRQIRTRDNPLERIRQCQSGNGLSFLGSNRVMAKAHHQLAVRGGPHGARLSGQRGGHPLAHGR